ncbi:ABC transporter transmembrane domain-containing protein [Streptomyces sp. NPDC058286]|uniref:ABC transporter transmembrane domain-containing protein n=1 Tax=Streptomyces sp. NPDC058286 TaxID=3346422 RepID=UPI0036E69EF6
MRSVTYLSGEPPKRVLVVLVCAGLLHTAATVSIPFQLTGLINAASEDSQPKQVAVRSVIVVAAAILAFVGAITWFRAAALIGRNAVMHIRRKVVGAIIRDQKEVSIRRITSQANSDLLTLENFILVGLEKLFRSVVSIILILIVLAWVDLFLAAVLLLAMPVLLVLAKRYSRNTGVMQIRSFAAYGRLQAAFMELREFATLARIMRMSMFADSVKASVEKVEAIRRNGVRLNGYFPPRVILVANLSLVAVVAVQSWRFHSGTGNLSTFLIFFLFASQLFGPVEDAADFLQALAGVKAASRRLKNLVDQPSSYSFEGRASAVNGLWIGSLVHEIPKSKFVLRAAGLSASIGSTVAVVGESGAGKSTLARKCSGWLDTGEANVSLQGRGGAWTTTRDRINSTCFVAQNASLIEGTLSENLEIGQGSLELGWKIVTEILEEETAVFFPDGPDSTINPSNLPLPRRAKSAVLIARTLTSTRSLLIFDETLSGFSSTAQEVNVLKVVKRNCGDRIILVITHSNVIASVSDVVWLVAAGRVSDLTA